MVRWAPDSRGKLEQAALALYAERGYERTTVAEIAERAGVTERTFFRHFADKREVLFSGSAMVQELLIRSVAEAPTDLAPIDAVAVGLVVIAGLMQERRDYARVRQTVIAANAELRERELIKLAAWSASLTETLRQRGVPEPDASLSAQIGMVVFHTAFERWLSPTTDQTFATLIRETLGHVKATVGAA